MAPCDLGDDRVTVPAAHVAAATQPRLALGWRWRARVGDRQPGRARRQGCGDLHPARAVLDGAGDEVVHRPAFAHIALAATNLDYPIADLEPTLLAIRQRDLEEPSNVPAFLDYDHDVFTRPERPGGLAMPRCPSALRPAGTFRIADRPGPLALGLAAIARARQAEAAAGRSRVEAAVAQTTSVGSSLAPNGAGNNSIRPLEGSKTPERHLPRTDTPRDCRRQGAKPVRRGCQPGVLFESG